MHNINLFRHFADSTAPLESDSGATPNLSLVPCFFEETLLSVCMFVQPITSKRYFTTFNID